MTTIEANIGNHVNIKQNPNDPCQAIAWVSFPKEPVVLNYAEVCNVLDEVQTVRRHIEWAMTDYVRVRDLPGQKWHITDKDHWQMAFCKRAVRPDWYKEPIIDRPSPELCCKRCFRAYEADIQPDMEEALEHQAVQHIEDRQNHSTIQF